MNGILLSWTIRTQEPPWSNDPDERFAFDPNFDEFGDYTQRAIQTLSILDNSSTYNNYLGILRVQSFSSHFKSYVYYENPIFVISVTYKIQFGSKDM